MKTASLATQNILSTGQYLRADLYAFTLAAAPGSVGPSYYFTSYQTPLTVAVATGQSSFATAHTYLTGLTIARGSMPQAVGVDAQDMQLTVSPAWDNPGGAPLVAGYPFQVAARLGLLDNATLNYAKFFGVFPTPPAQLDTSPGAVGWFVGAVQEIQINRLTVEMKISSNLLLLTQTQMPRNLYQAGCVHNVYDSGCLVNKSAFTVSGSVSSVPTGAVPGANFNTNLTQADHWFELGVLTFTSGANNGYSATVKSFAHTSGNIQFIIPFPFTVAVGDTFTVFPGCDKVQTTCVNKFNNLMHFKATPFVPVPETLYSGASVSPPTPPPAPAQQKPTNTAPGGIMSGIVLPNAAGWNPTTGTLGNI